MVAIEANPCHRGGVASDNLSMHLVFEGYDAAIVGRMNNQRAATIRPYVVVPDYPSAVMPLL